MLLACRLPTCAKPLIVLTAILLLVVFTKTSRRSMPPSKRLVKATINYQSLSNPYNEVLALHNKQNAHFGYVQHELHVPIVKGRANLFYFLISILTDQLTKPVESRAEWILYFDPDTVPLHPTLPLDLLLPPPLAPDASNTDSFEAFKELSLIHPAPVTPVNARNHTLDLNTFWLRTTPSTLRILTEALHELHASTELPRPGEDVAASALQGILNRQDDTRTVVYQPSEWYGGRTTPGADGGGITGVRALLAHPGMGNAFERASQVRPLLDIARRNNDGSEEVRREMEREVSSFWARELATRKQ